MPFHLSPSRTKTSAFTILEILLVLFLILLVSSISILNIDSILKLGSNSKPPEQTLYFTLKEAKTLALEHASIVLLSYNPEKHSFFISLPNHSTSHLATIPLPPKTRVTFLPLPFSESKWLSPNNFQTFSSEPPIHSVPIHPDGSMSPIAVTFSSPDAPSSTWEIDPFSASLIPSSSL